MILSRICIAGLFFQLSCGKTSGNSDSNFKGQLVQKQIGESKYCISIPPNYSIKESEGPDFIVHYFSPSDTSMVAAFRGGFYMGDHPHEFDPDNDSCKTEKIKSKLLGHNADWKVYICNGEYEIQAITKSKSSEGWNSVIHAFGAAKSKVELNKLLQVFSTLRKNQ